MGDGVFVYTQTHQISFKDVYLDKCSSIERLPFERVKERKEFNEWFGSGEMLSIKFSSRDISVFIEIYRTKKGDFFLIPHIEGKIRIRGMFIHISLPANEFDEVLIDGMQSWSASYLTSISNSEVPLEEHILMDEFYDLLLTDPRMSWWFTGIKGDNNFLIFGALSFEVWKSRYFVWKKNGVLHLYIYSGNTKTCMEVENEKFEFYYIAERKDMWTALEDYVDLLKTQYPPPEEPFNPIGWNSWNTFFDEVNINDVLRNARFIKENLQELRVNNIQIDDGWEVRWGDWGVNERFGGSYEGITRPITEMGFFVGIWIAPLLADENSEVFKRHPAWFLKDEEGEFITQPIFSGRTIYILDLTHPSVLPWIEENIVRLLKAGFRYLKLDYLYTALIEGDSFYNVAPLQRYRSFMNRIRELAEDYSAYVLACGAPFLPSSGLVHGIRTGGDIALKGMQYSAGFVYNELRNHLLRSVFNPVIRGDPDTLLLRDIDIEDGRVFAYAIINSGGIFALGDDLPSLPDEKVNLLREVSALPEYPPSREVQWKCYGCFFFQPIKFPVPNFVFGDLSNFDVWK